MVNHPNRSKAKQSKLHHFSHENGVAEIVVNGGTEQEKVVGVSRRTPFPLGGYIYTISDTSENEVYTGNSMAHGLEALEKHLGL